VARIEHENEGLRVVFVVAVGSKVSHADQAHKNLIEVGVKTASLLEVCFSLGVFSVEVSGVRTQSPEVERKEDQIDY